MNCIFVDTKDINKAKTAVKWATKFVPMLGGFLAFENDEAYRTWLRR